METNGHVPTLDSISAAKHIPREFLENIGIKQTPRGLNIPYYNADATFFRMRLRIAMKAKDGSRWAKGEGLIPYGRWWLKAWEKRCLHLVEGETDCWALWHQGFAALGIPGASNAGCLSADDLETHRAVYIHREPGKGGETFVNGVLKQLQKLKYAYKAWEWSSPRDVKDPSDLWILSPETFRSDVDRAMVAGKKIFPASEGNAIPEKPQREVQGSDAYYDQASGRFFVMNGFDEWQGMAVDAFKRRLGVLGYEINAPKGGGMSQADYKIDAICLDKNVHWAGELAGFESGLQSIAGHRVLCTRGMKLIKPVPGKWPILGKFFRTLLADQRIYFFGWLKGALEAIEAGTPFQEGQALVVGGPPGCGKNFLQEVVTHVLGGRVANPWEHMSSGEKFNGDLARCEHLQISDEGWKGSQGKRSELKAKLKTMLVNKRQRINPKGTVALMLEPFWRITITVNEEPENLAVLPPLEGDILRKLIILRAKKGMLPRDEDRTIKLGDQWEAIAAELPHFVHFLCTLKITKTVQDWENRFAVESYHDKSLADMINDLASEKRLMELIDDMFFRVSVDEKLEGKSGAIEFRLRDFDKTGQMDPLIKKPGGLGGLLSSLAKSSPDRVSILRREGNQNVYLVEKVQKPLES